MEKKHLIRLIAESDLEEVLAIYQEYVLNTAITFEYEVPDKEEFLQRIRTNSADYPWLVCTENNKIIGYAYGSRHRYKTAYQWSPESTIYVERGSHGKGIGRKLYNTLFSILKLQGYFNVYAGVALPNAGSEKLHRMTGFEEIGDFKKIGYKLGKWHDVKWFHLQLSEHTGDPEIPKGIAEIRETAAFHNILRYSNEELNARL